MSGGEADGRSVPRWSVEASIEPSMGGRVEPGDARGPKGMRGWVINGALVFVIAGSLFDIITFREHWPFSPYWMYSHARVERTLDAAWLFGVAAGGGAAEVALMDERYVYPFDVTKVRVALERMAEDPSDRGRLRAALADCLERYDALRRAGVHHGPPLRGVRLYRMRWSLDPWARNAGDPDRRELILEVLRPAGGGG